MCPASAHRRCPTCGFSQPESAPSPHPDLGDPGVAKTATLTAFGRASGYHVKTVVGSVREPSDFMGLPFEDDGTVRYTVLSWAQWCAHAERALLFLDDLTTAPPSVQRAMLRILQERVVGEFVLPERIFDQEYPYISSVSSSWVAHAGAYARDMRDALELTSNDLVVEVASNDGYLLEQVAAIGM